MNTFSIIASLLTHSLAWALLYSLWQGLLIYGTLYVVLKALPNINARAKYYLSFGSFTALLLWFADTWSTEYQKLKGITVYVTQQGMDMAASTTYAVKSVSTAHLQSPLVHGLLPGVERYFPFIILLYSLGLSFMLFRFVVSVLQIGRLKTSGIQAPEEYWSDFIQRWQKELDITRKVKLYLTDRVNVPMMLGALKPVILLPIATINHLSTEQVEAILLHELAHIKRHDYLLNILQATGEALLFFNPFVWLISGIIRREREHCCDDMVINCDASPLSYAQALAALADNRMHGNRLALAATGSKHQLYHRIKRIMEIKKRRINYSQLTILLVAFVAISFSIAMFTFSPSFAQKIRGDRSDTTHTSKTTYRSRTVTVEDNGNRTEVIKEYGHPPATPEEPETPDTGTNIAENIYGAPGSHKEDGEVMNKIVADILTIAKQKIATIDYKQIENEIKSASVEMSELDLVQINADIDRAVAEIERQVNDAHMQKDVARQIKTEMQHHKAELQHLKREMANLKRMHVEITAPTAPLAALAAIAPIAPIAAPAMVCKAPAPKPGNNFEDMLEAMEQDGLLNRQKRYSIEKEQDELIINGTKQPARVYVKYEAYMRDKTVTIRGNKNDLTINIKD